MAPVTTRFKPFRANDVPSQCFDYTDRTCPTIVQIGANNGEEGEEYGFQEFLSELENFNLYLFEPIEKHFSNLPSVYDRFSGPTRKIHYCNYAIAESNSNAKMNDAGGMSKITDNGSLDIVTRTWTGVVAEYRLDKIDLLLLDCEGYEHTVLKQFDLVTLAPQVIRYEYVHIPDLDGFTKLLSARGYTIEDCATDPAYNKIARL